MEGVRRFDNPFCFVFVSGFSSCLLPAVFFQMGIQVWAEGSIRLHGESLRLSHPLLPLSDDFRRHLVHQSIPHFLCVFFKKLFFLTSSACSYPFNLNRTHHVHQHPKVPFRSAFRDRKNSHVCLLIQCELC